MRIAVFAFAITLAATESSAEPILLTTVETTLISDSEPNWLNIEFASTGSFYQVNWGTTQIGDVFRFTPPGPAVDGRDYFPIINHYMTHNSGRWMLAVAGDTNTVNTPWLWTSDTRITSQQTLIIQPEIDAVDGPFGLALAGSGYHFTHIDATFNSSLIDGEWHTVVTAQFLGGLGEIPEPQSYLLALTGIAWHLARRTRAR